MARCFGCHLERSLGPVPVQGTPSGQVLCPRCSKQIDQSIGILEALGFVVTHQTDISSLEVQDSPNGTEADVKKGTRTNT